jgi:membrane-bound metal-dependent hydrolase YbcI (DUF457 family)
VVVPSPIVHSATAVALTSLVYARTPPESARRTLALGVAVVAANAPDLDFVPGILMGAPGRFHHGPSHSLVAAAIAGVAALAFAWPLARDTALRLAGLTALALASHVLLDMLSSWADAQHGVALLWPVSSDRYVFPFSLFLGIRLEPEHAGFITGLMHWRNVGAVLWEIVVVLAVWAVVRRFRSRGTGKSSSRPSGENPAPARRFQP